MLKKTEVFFFSDLAANLRVEDLSDISPTVIAIEVSLHPILCSIFLLL